MKKGSALLIVLGMLAFMIVSAVAFAAYMRYARLPSSYLRRSSLSRELTKAALARAIDELDRALCNNPHPGIGDARVASSNMNFFAHHVYMGPGAERLADAVFADTTPVLTLEGLAYIPPPLVNEARYFGRLTPSARWQSFDFDAGRYAFVALDVSDCLDINRLRADCARSSAANSRVSLAYIMEDASHSSPGSGASQWDSWMESFRTFDNNTLSFDYASKVPLVSLADFNLALGASGKSGLYSPWCRYLTGSGGAGFYATSSPQEEDLLRRMTFITDSYYPPVEAESDSADDADWDLNDPQYQPFTMDELEQSRPELVDVIEPQVTRYSKALAGVGCAALWDYLDPDRVPVSLALPTVERTPMVCGLRTTLDNCKIKIVRTETEQTAAPDNPTVGTIWQHKRVIEYKIDGASFSQGLMGGEVKPLIVYPFCRDDGSPEGSWKLDGHLALFFTSEDMKLHTSPNDVLHFGAYVNATAQGLGQNGVIMLQFGQNASLSFKAANIAKNPDSAVKEVSCPLSSSASVVGPQLENAPLLTVTYEWEQAYVLKNHVPQWDPDTAYADGPPPAECLTEARCGIPPLKSTGVVDGDFSGGKLLSTLRSGVDAGPTLKFNAAVWLGIKESDKYVDLVPACLKDDQDLGLGSQNYNMMGPEGDALGGSPYPLLRYSMGLDEFKLSVENLEKLAGDGTELPVGPTPRTIVVDDPRYNYAPENWYEPDWDLSASNWRDKNGSGGDIFMNTSDQGYLQSVYELAFLPRVTNLRRTETRKIPGSLTNPNDGRAELSRGQKGPDNAVHSDFMWQTYDPFDADDAAAFEDLHLVNSGSGVKINPYSDSTNVLMAAFANTPLDWTCASTNVTSNGKDYGSMSASEFNAKYAWNEYSSGGKIAYEDLEHIARAFREKIANGGSAYTVGDQQVVMNAPNYNAWEDAWRDLGWRTDTDETLAGQTLSGDTDDLWEIDRKFLYGYWRDCFGARQQLFLVFVRAEPLMMGGGAMSKIPPQLGGRAVALVWRDPTANETQVTQEGLTGTGYPHQTRILFYKPLD